MTRSPSEQAPRKRVPRRLWPVLAALLPAALIVGGAAWRSVGRIPVPEPPPVPPAGLEPAVAGSIRDAEGRVRQSPGDAGAWGRLGMLLGAYGFRTEAAACFTTAERLDPREPRWPYFRGLALYQDGAQAESVSSLRRAVALCPREPDAPRLLLAEAVLKEGGLEEAEAQFRALLQDDPGHPPAHLGLARLALARGDPVGAEVELQPCLRSPFTRKAGHLLRAEVQQRLGHREASGESLRRAASLPPDAPWPDPFRQEVEGLKADRQTRLDRAQALQGRGEFEEAQGVLEGLEGDYPGTAPFLEGRRRLQAGDARGAARDFREAIRLAPDFAQGHFWLGVALREGHDAGGAAAAFREAVRLQPRHAAAYRELGLCLLETGDRAGALDALQTAAQYTPQDAEVQRQLALLFAQSGRQAEALEHASRALSLDPDDVQARDLAGRLRGGP